MRLLKEIEISKQVFESGANWKLKYEVVFARHTKVILPLLEACDIGFNWTDPNADYDDDVRAYMDALLKLGDDLAKLPDDCFAYAEIRAAESA